MTDRLDAALDKLPRAYAGPGGAVAVLRDGAVIARHAWGWANAERRIPFTPRTLFRMCSVTKQFTCAALLDLFPDPTVLDGDLRGKLPLLEEPTPSAAHLCHNQSGHFASGTRSSYVNQNFRLLSDLLQDRTGKAFADLLRERVFARVGMETAILAADTRALPDGTEGYEGTQAGGFRAAENRILWTGDAGLGASLDDMIAWERHIDATRDDADSLYGRISAPVRFANGAEAHYGFGLGRGRDFGRAHTGHGGALRGWRCHRMYLPEERVSVVVMFNHFGDAHGAALDLLAAVLGEQRPSADESIPPPAWLGAYVEPETGLSARVETSTAPGHVLLRFGHSPERLDLAADNTAGNGRTKLRMEADGLWMDRPQENFSTRLQPVSGEVTADVGGRYRCAELDAEVTVVETGGTLYGGFSGFLGQGRMELLNPIAPDLWALPCPRALDHTPPGDWTLAFRRDSSGKPTGVEVGCWLARRLNYEKV
jgi:D-aminopeptidase